MKKTSARKSSKISRGRWGAGEAKDGLSTSQTSNSENVLNKVKDNLQTLGLLLSGKPTARRHTLKSMSCHNPLVKISWG